jgi:hypothetical protein
MNAERLHAIAIALKKEMDERNTLGKLQNLITTLQNLVNNPAHAQHQQSFSQARDEMYATVLRTPSDEFSASWCDILRAIGGEKMVGNALKAKIENAFERNPLTPAVTLGELHTINNALKEFKNALDQLVSSLTLFNIGHETLKPGECEIGILIPRAAVEHRLSLFAKELKEFESILGVFSEVATGRKDELRIRTISTSELLVYLSAVPPAAACFAFAIDKVVDAYKKILDIRSHRNSLHKQGVPDDAMAGIEIYANKKMGETIEQVTQEIVKDFYKKGDEGRRHELNNHIKIALYKIAKRIDSGYSLEVRAQPLEPSDKKGSDTQTQRSISLIMAARPNMQFISLGGRPILMLPEGAQKPPRKSPTRRKKIAKANEPSSQS